MPAPLRPAATATAPASPATRAARGKPAATALRPAGTPVRRATAIPAPLAPGIHLNEILTNPLPTDWNADGWTEAADSWIELYNSGRAAVNLAGWTLVSSSITGTQTITETYQLPAGVSMQPGAYLLIFSEQSGLSLSPAGGRLQLRTARGALDDQALLPALAPGASYSRDRLGRWHSDWPPSPGAANGAPRIIGQDELTPAPPPREPLPR